MVVLHRHDGGVGGADLTNEKDCNFSTTPSQVAWIKWSRGIGANVDHLDLSLSTVQLLFGVMFFLVNEVSKRFCSDGGTVRAY